jgi:hypothetical protein
VQPDGVPLANVSHSNHRVDAGRGCRPHRGDDRDWYAAGVAVGRNLGVEKVGAHPEVVVHRNPGERIVAQADRDHRLVHRRVRLLRAVNAQGCEVVASCQPLGSHVGDRGFARRRHRVQRGNRRGVVNDPLERRGEPNQLPEPAERDRLEFGRGGRRAPQHGLLVEGGCEKIGEHTGGTAGGTEVREERRMVPMGEARYEHALEIGHDGAEGFRILRRIRWQCCGDLPRRHPRKHGVFLGVLQVLGDPVDHLVAVTPERRRIHATAYSSGRSSARTS